MIISEHSIQDFSTQIAARFSREAKALSEFWNNSKPVRHLVIDDLLPIEWAKKIAASFPKMDQLRRYESRKEYKGVGVAMDEYAPILKAITFAFQDPKVLDAVMEVTQIGRLQADANLYSSGLSAMGEGDFLNPHIDNSGNPLLQQYRRINALYYVTPEWNPDWGGSLELWDANRSNPIVLPARFNRLILMNTNRTSFHSVSAIRSCQGKTRNCVSNYYFSPESPEGYEYFHVTSFRGRPEQPLLDSWLRMDASVRGLYRRFFPRKAEAIKHKYQ